MAKEKIPADSKIQDQDINLFEMLAALDKKDYGYYDRLTDEQKRKFVPYMTAYWMCSIKADKNMQRYYLSSVDYHANRYLFNEYVIRHPKLQWLMFCAASPGMGKQYHKWVPMIRNTVAKFKERATLKESKQYFEKIYPTANEELLQEISNAYVVEQKRKVRLCELFPSLKLSDIEILSQIATDEDIKKYEQDLGNQ